MGEKSDSLISRDLRFLIVLFSIFIVLFIFTLVMPGILTWISFFISLLMTGYVLFLLKMEHPPGKRHLPSLFSIILIILPFLFGGLVAFQGYRGETALPLIVVSVGQTITFWNSFLTVPLAVYHKKREEEKPPLDVPPRISVIVPAHNEEEVLGKTIEAILESEYPSDKKEIIVVDDGSTDRTLGVASRYEQRGVRVFHKEKGGKYSALNYGLKFARGEIIITIDADSIVGRKALKEIVRSFQKPEVVAVCGNIKVLNRENWLTKCQALEYILGINLFRRAFDIFGAVTVVPGALGAFRREILEGGGLYDKDTVTEDFDVTVKTLKTGKIVQASSQASTYTEAPQTLKDLYKQRMRWYRGTLQTLIKHKDAFLNPRFDFLQKITFPYLVVSTTFLPFVGIAVTASIIIALIQGAWLSTALLILLFVTLQYLRTILAIELDEEEMSLTPYGLFFVIGYKHLTDILHIKALLDILLKREVRWTSAERVGHSPPQKKKGKPTS